MALSRRMNVTGHVYRFTIMNNRLSFQGAICICIPSYRPNDISVGVIDD